MRLFQSFKLHIIQFKQIIMKKLRIYIALFTAILFFGNNLAEAQTNQQSKEKKGMSKKAKGAVIGGVSGAAAGRVIAGKNGGTKGPSLVG
jgi:osmotically inducible lipoprotein OsmB